MLDSQLISDLESGQDLVYYSEMKIKINMPAPLSRDAWRAIKQTRNACTETNNPFFFTTTINLRKRRSEALHFLQSTLITLVKHVWSRKRWQGV